MVNAIPIDREHWPGLDGQGGVRGGSEPRERALPGKEFAMPTKRMAMHVLEEVLRLRWYPFFGQLIGRFKVYSLVRRAKVPHPSGGQSRPATVRSSRYVEYLVMWSWAAKPLPHNTFGEIHST